MHLGSTDQEGHFKENTYKFTKNKKNKRKHVSGLIKSNQTVRGFTSRFQPLFWTAFIYSLMCAHTQVWLEEDAVYCVPSQHLLSCESEGTLSCWVQGRCRTSIKLLLMTSRWNRCIDEFILSTAGWADRHNGDCLNKHDNPPYCKVLPYTPRDTGGVREREKNRV